MPSPTPARQATAIGNAEPLRQRLKEQKCINPSVWQNPATARVVVELHQDLTELFMLFDIGFKLPSLIDSFVDMPPFRKLINLINRDYRWRSDAEEINKLLFKLKDTPEYLTQHNAPIAVQVVLDVVDLYSAEAVEFLRKLGAPGKSSPRRYKIAAGELSYEEIYQINAEGWTRDELLHVLMTRYGDRHITMRHVYDKEDRESSPSGFYLWHDEMINSPAHRAYFDGMGVQEFIGKIQLADLANPKRQCANELAVYLCDTIASFEP